MMLVHENLERLKIVLFTGMLVLARSFSELRYDSFN